jgi:hypothetical protein
MIRPCTLRLSVISPALVAPTRTRQAGQDPGYLLREAARQAKVDPRRWAEMEDAKVTDLLHILPKMADAATTQLAAARRDAKALRLACTRTKKRHVELLERIDKVERVYGRKVTDEEIRRWAQNQIVGSDYGEVFSGRVISSRTERDIAAAALPAGTVSTFLTNATLSQSGRDTSSVQADTAAPRRPMLPSDAPADAPHCDEPEDGRLTPEDLSAQLEMSTRRRPSS